MSLLDKYRGTLVSSKNSEYVGYEPTGVEVLDASPEDLEALKKVAKRNGHRLNLAKTGNRVIVMSNQWPKP